MGKLIILSGPSGVGKDTVIEELMKTGRFAKIKTCTSRQPREGEDESSYYFLTREHFESRILAESFVEYTVYDGEYYGTHKDDLNLALKGVKDVILRIDIQGFQEIQDSNIHIDKSIFILPPDIETLRKRLVERATETEEQFDQRMKVALEEIEFSYNYDEQVTNDNLTMCVQAILQSI